MHPIIPMTPEQLPQQRLYAVKGLSERPQGFFGCNAEGRDLRSDLAPLKMPSTARFLASVEWAWSPMHSRIDGYYISTNRHRSHWLLWHSYYDDNTWPPCWRKQLWEYGPKKGVPERVAAIYLLADAWESEYRHSDLDPFRWVNDTGLFTVADLMAIAKVVWPHPNSEK